jgi:hypothetical protein
MIAQEDDALAGDAFIAGGDGGVEDYGVVEVKGWFRSQDISVSTVSYILMKMRFL